MIIKQVILQKELLTYGSCKEYTCRATNVGWVTKMGEHLYIGHGGRVGIIRGDGPRYPPKLWGK